MAVPLTSYRTPGVYVQEIQKLPPSIAQVETAVPVFIGYTQKAELNTSKDLQNVPTKIRSEADFINLFGTKDPEDLHVSINQITSSGRRIIQIENKSDPLYQMYYAIQLFYANGGGEAFIISVGDLTDPIDQGQLEGALELLTEYTEPTLILFPDAVNGLSSTGYHNLSKLALSFCARPKINNSFVILDVKQVNGKASDVDADVLAFRQGVTGSIDELKYGAAYYPYLETTLPYVRSLNNIEIVSDLVDGETAKEVEDRLTLLNDSLDDGDPQREVTQKALEQAINRRTQEDKSKDVYDSQIKPKIDGYDSLVLKKVMRGDIVRVANKAVEQGKTGTELKEDVKKEIPDDQTAILGAVDAVELMENGTPRTAAAVRDEIINEVDTALTSGDDNLEKQLFDARNAIVEAKNAALPIFRAGAAVKAFAHTPLDILSNVDNSLFNQILDALNSTGVIMPPSSVIAGVYARVDNTRGVFKAPANVGLAAVSAPHRIISDEIQDDLNIDSVSGKSINVIRTFKGIGTLVWGARTLAGNDREWRYISVRRFFNMVEESVKRALFPSVFEPNNRNTWTSVRVSIEAFLETQWRAGALLGNTLQEAFFVRVGLNETMTEADILDGFMVVEIGMAVVRPAEFIVLKFMHKFELGQ